MAQLDRRPRRPGSTRWSLASIHFVALLMVWEADTSLQDCFCSARQHFAEMFPHLRRPGKSYQGFIKAQRLISGRMKRHLLDHLRNHHRRIAGAAWQYRGWTAFACDGSRIEAPRTLRNQRALGCAGRQRTGPQLFLTTMYHLGTGLPWDWRIGRGCASERDHLRSMLGTLPPHSLIVADAGFTGYELLKTIVAGGHSFLIRAGSNVRLLTGLQVEVRQRGTFVSLWPARRRTQPPLTLRLIRVGEVCLLTNVLDTSALSSKTASQLYRLRWGVELFFRSYKQTLEARKLRSRCPRHARAELYWGITGLLLLGLMSLEQRPRRDIPRRLSVAGALRVIRHALRTNDTRRRRRNLLDRLRSARLDGYRRCGSKTSRAFPRKKAKTTPGRPKIRQATPRERGAAQALNNAA
jgi:hypothetical protein